MKKKSDRKPPSQSKPPVKPPVRSSSSLFDPERWAPWVILGLLVLSPLLVLPADLKLPAPTDVPRRLLLALGAGLLSAGVLLRWAQQQRVTWRFHPLDLGVLLFVAGAALAGIRGAYPQLSFFSTLWTQHFTSFAAYVIGFGLYLGVKEFLREPAQELRAAWVAVLTGGAVAVIGIIDYASAHFLGVPGLHPAFSNTRLVATLGNPMFTGTFFAMLIPLAAGTAIAQAGWRRKCALTSLAVMAIALLLTHTRGAWLGLGVSLGLLIPLLLWRWRVTREGIALVLGGIAAGTVAAGVLAVLLVPQLKAMALRVINRTEGTVQTRAVYMTGAWRMFQARPLTGWGPGTLHPVSAEYRPSSMAYEGEFPLNRGYSASLPHNIMFQVAAEMGLVGLAGFALLLLLLLYAGLRITPMPGPAGWLGLGVFGMLLAYLAANLAAYDNAATWSLCWIGLALLAGLPARDCRSRSLPALAPVWRVAAVVIGVGAAVIVFTQTLAVSYLARGIDGIDLTYQEGQRDVAQAYALSQAAVDDLFAARSLAPLPDPTTFDALTMAYRAQAVVAPDEEKMKDARARMFVVGRDGLRILDRDSQLQRLLTREYMTEHKLPEAQKICLQLIKHEPFSSEVRLIYAELLEDEGKINDALAQVKAAEKRDATNPDIYAMRAHLRLIGYQTEMSKRGNPRIDPLVQEISRDFRRTLDELQGLTSEYRQEYATILFLQGDAAEAIEQGRLLKAATQKSPGEESPQVAALCNTILAIGGNYNRGREAMEAVMAIRAQQEPASPPSGQPPDPLAGIGQP